MWLSAGGLVLLWLCLINMSMLGFGTDKFSGMQQGMLRSEVVGQFYKDLKNENFRTAFAVYHRRYSTNTSPRWPLAQPMRVLGHNGMSACLQYNLQSCMAKIYMLTS